ncbi:MAG: hypothetical protein WCF18_21570 [Chthoniobacteraceae bacterium]
MVALALVVGVLFIREPGFGDELTYWSLAFGLHETGGAAWSVHSFHDLRWPVWGVSWLWQSVFGPGLASFYCTPLLYLAAAATLVFSFGRVVLRSLSAAWVGGIALLFLPLLDPVISRAMPDLSESTFGACALLAWWAMMKSAPPRRAALFGLLSGVSIGLAFANRLTGIFIAPVLAVATLLFFPRRWKWLFLPAAVAALFFVAEGATYYAICGDWLHSIHANLGGRGATDTQVLPVWQLPVRYLGGFFRANRLAPIYAVLAVGGLWTAWRKWGTGGRLIVVWFCVLYLEYSCAVQSIHPVRPLIGSTVRYLAALAIPMSLLVGLGALEAGRLLAGIKWEPARRLRSWLARHSVLAGAGAVVMLALYTSRPFFDLGFAVEQRRRMATLPDATKIFTHPSMRDVAFLVDPADARRFTWVAPKAILERTPELEAQAAGCDEVWYLRKQLWMTRRKAMERNGSNEQPPLGTYFDTPERDWLLADVLAKGSDSDLVFYRRRPAGSPAPHILTADSPEFRGIFPALPAEWSSQHDRKSITTKWNVPPALRGKLLALEFRAASPTVEPLIAKLQFMAGRRRSTDLLLKPILYAGGGKEFFAVPIPADAETCTVELHFPAKTKHVQLADFRAVFDDAR